MRASPPLTTAAGNRSVVDGALARHGRLTLAEVLAPSIALEQRSFGLLFATSDQKEGTAAFLAKPKRAAKFEGR